MVEFFVVHRQGDRVLRKSLDEFEEDLYELVNDDIENSNSETIVRAKSFSNFIDVKEFLSNRLFVMKVKNHPQVFFHPSYRFEPSFSGFVCPSNSRMIHMPEDNQYAVLWELSKM